MSELDDARAAIDTIARVFGGVKIVRWNGRLVGRLGGGAKNEEPRARDTRVRVNERLVDEQGELF